MLKTMHPIHKLVSLVLSKLYQKLSYACDIYIYLYATDYEQYINVIKFYITYFCITYPTLVTRYFHDIFVCFTSKPQNAKFLNTQDSNVGFLLFILV